MSNRSLQWGILGTGHIANVMAKAIKETKHNHLLAVASRTKKNAESFANCYELSYFYHEYDDLLHNEAIDVVYIALPNTLHMEWIIRAAQAGKHILCEKPFTVNVNQAKLALDSVKKAGVFCMEAMMYRCHPQYYKIIELLKQGMVGNIHLIEAIYNVPQQLNTIHLNPRLASGSIMDMGCYCISAACLVAGIQHHLPFSQPVELSALGHVNHEGLDEFASAILKFKQNIFATITNSTQYGRYYSLRITGDKGSLIAPTPWSPKQHSSIFLEYFDGKKSQIDITANLSMYGYEVEKVAAFIHAGKKQADSSAMSWNDTLQNMQTLDRWREALGLDFNL